MEEQPTLQEIQLGTPLRTYYGDERRRPLGGAYDGAERRIPDPPTEQDWDPEPPPN
jgi:hypothetical protein